MRSTYITLLCAGLLACGDTRSDEPRVLAQESTISSGGGAVERFRVAAEPTVVIGADDSRAGQELYNVRDVAFLPAGLLAIANTGTHEILVCDTTGRRVRAIGRAGEGPGEFRSLTGMAVIGDTIVAYDQYLRRASWFALDGSNVRTQPVIAPVLSGMSFLGTIDGRPAIRTSEIISRQPTRSPPEIRFGQTTDSLIVISFDPDGSDFNVLLNTTGSERYLMEYEGRGVVYYPFGFDARAMAVTDGRRLIHGRSDRAQFTVISGDTAVHVTWDAEPEPYSREYEDSLRAYEMRSPEGLDGQSLMSLNESPKPVSLPLYDRMLMSAEGDVWIRAWAWPGEPTRTWLVFDVSGKRTAVVTAPVDLQIVAASRNGVLTRHRDELDVETVALYRLLR